MALPAPRPGLVFRYDYLWSHEAAIGRDEGKDRPACLLVASDPSMKPKYVVILPITHSAPADDSGAIEIPPAVRHFLGLDDVPCWIVASQYNVDDWPNAGIRPLPGRPGVFSYGFIPPRLFHQVRAKFLALVERGRSAGVRRP